MLLNALEVLNSRGATLNLPLEDTSGGFVVQKIEGLDPVKATLVSSSFANMDGEQFHSSRREARNIKLTLGLDPDYAVGSVKDLRDFLYQYFMPKSRDILTFRMFDKFATEIFNQYLNLNIEAYIESFDSDLFVAEPTVDISMMCFDPDFFDPNLVTFDGMTVSDTTTGTVTYDGTIETGVILTIRPNRAMTDVTIYHTPPDGTQVTVYISYPLLAGDVLQVSSVTGSKSATLLRGGVESSVLYAISPQSGWLTLQPGDNGLRVYAVGAPVPFDIQYLNKYGGL